MIVNSDPTLRSTLRAPALGDDDGEWRDRGRETEDRGWNR